MLIITPKLKILLYFFHFFGNFIYFSFINKLFQIYIWLIEL